MSMRNMSPPLDVTTPMTLSLRAGMYYNKQHWYKTLSQNDTLISSFYHCHFSKFEISKCQHLTVSITESGSIAIYRHLAQWFLSGEISPVGNVRNFGEMLGHKQQCCTNVLY